MSVQRIIDEKRLIICVGAGGVGKTTTAAALALGAARRGRKVLVLTIDPARRLANSLGLRRVGNEETRIDLGPLGAISGELWAMMLDNRKTFDDLIGRVSPDAGTRDAILQNRIYRAVADNIAGSQDYMATEKLYDLVQTGTYDLIVLDTPPVKNALDFIEAPGRLARFLDKRIMRWFLTPYDEGRVFGRLIFGTSAVVFRLLGFIFGREFLSELSEFFLHFRDLYDGFRERHEAVVRLFHDADSAFVIVSSPAAPSLEVARYFIDELRRRDMPTAGMVVNQRHRAEGEGSSPEAVLGELARELSADLPPDTAARLLARLGAAHRRLVELSQEEATLVAPFEGEPAVSVWSVPRMEREVHDLLGLDQLGAHLGVSGSGGGSGTRL